MRVARRETAPALRNLSLIGVERDQSSMLEDVRRGLRGQPKSLPPRLFYDAEGARLFEHICRTRAYYPTRTEIAIFQQRSAAIGQMIDRGGIVIEPGAGDMRKIRLLLRDLAPLVYAPIDVSEEQLIEEARSLACENPWLEVMAFVGDFDHADLAAHLPRRNSRLLFFPGSTIGNLSPDQAREFLRRARELVGPTGHTLVGVDLVKDRAILDLAYNDPEGYTARFNLNLLARLNRDLGANFDLSAFEHRAFYDANLQRVEMHLMSRRAQSVRLHGELIRFAAGETIHTENSYKYEVDQFARLAQTAGFDLRECWRDARGWFGVFLFVANGPDAP